MKKTKVRQGTQTTAYGFHGMSNVRSTKGFFIDQSMLTTPSVVLNSDVMDDGVIVKRGGYKKKISLTNCHSVWADSVMLCVADGTTGLPALHIIRGVTATNLTYINSQGNVPMHYAEYDGLVYMSNGYWSGIYNIETSTIRNWGLTLPATPIVEPTAGSLPPGTYSLCYTYYDGTRISGNGGIVTIRWEGDSQGIRLLNKPSNAYCWITLADGGDFFLATVDSGAITSPYVAQPLPTFGVTEVPYLKYIQLAHGRLWGAEGKYLRYSESSKFEWFRDKNRFYFPDDITVIAPYNLGLYVSTLNKTWLLEGTDTSKMTMNSVGDVGIPGTYCIVEGRGYEISKEFSQVPTPIWVSKTGICTGTQTGRVVHLTEKNLKINLLDKGATIQRWLDGYPQLLVSLYGDTIGETDSSIRNIFKDGELFDSG
jgi:hypothetical protein